MSFLNFRSLAIPASVVIALVLVVGAYILSGRHVTDGTQAVSAESTDELLKAYAAKDTDADGLADWEEALYGTNPRDAHSVRENLTDGQAVAQGLATPRYAGQPAADSASSPVEVPGPAAAADSLTEQFARLFFNNYMATRGDTPPSADQAQAFVQDAVKSLEQTRVRPDAFSVSDIQVSGTGAVALKAYAAQADAAFGAHTVQLPFGELAYFSDAV